MNRGTAHVQISGADIPRSIRRISEKGIVLYSVEYVDLFTARFRIQRSQLASFRAETEDKGDKIEILGFSGFWIKVSKIHKRPVLLVMILFLLFLTAWLPKHILFVAVEGNASTSTELILQQAELGGVHFGTKRSDVRSEVLKNHLLETIPSLQWAGVNTVGCTAVIQVREDPAAQSGAEEIRFSSVVASVDGIVTSCTILSGTPACAVGDAVKQDQVLISGYQDLGLVVKTTRSKGEVFAQTEHMVRVVMPAQYQALESSEEEIVNYALIFGKKRINLSKDSGISYVGCDKIYTEYWLTLPGGFVLPVALVREQISVGQNARSGLDPEAAYVSMSDYADGYLLDSIVSGRILNRTVFSEYQNEALCLTIRYNCLEMIGRERKEEFRFEYGKND